MRIKAISVFETRETDQKIYSSEVISGYCIEPVRRIERRTENCGTYGITWYDVYKTGGETDKEYLHSSINALRVEEVRYFNEE